MYHYYLLIADKLTIERIETKCADKMYDCTYIQDLLTSYIFDNR